MWQVQCQSFLKAVQKVIAALIWQAKNQINRQVVKPDFSSIADRCINIFCSMNPTNALQDVIIKRLHANRQPVNPKVV